MFVTHMSERLQVIRSALANEIDLRKEAEEDLENALDDLL
jgi:hypothetical protein